MILNFPLDVASELELGGGARVSNSRMWEETGFPLTLRFSSFGASQLQLSYDPERFETADIEDITSRLLRILEQFATAKSIGDLQILDEQERRRQLDSYRGADLGEASGGLHRSIEDRADAQPDVVAVRDSSRCLTRRQLDQLANGLAWELQQRGVGAGDRVGIALPRNASMVIAVLAVLKAGAAYVSFDLNYPDQRNRDIFADARPKIMLAGPEIAHRFPSVECIPAHAGPRAEPPIRAQELDSRSLSYLIYTSGSTGRPKGVMIRHCNVLALIEWARRTLSSEQIRSTLFSTSLSFDISAFELFCTLALGGEVVVAQNALELGELSRTHPVTLINSTPSAYSALLARGPLPDSVTTVISCGEQLGGALVERLYQSPSVTKVYNLYGPSEDTTYSTGDVVPRGERVPSIGRPLPGTWGYVLDDDMQLVPRGAPGMLYLGGRGLAAGYWERPEKTADAFILDPFAADGSSIYRTGDIVRQRADGCLEFIGRRDGQVKIRGYRVELGEVRTVMESLPGIREAAIIVRRGARREPKIYAYIVSDGLDEAGTKALMRQRLPEAFVPSRVVGVTALPMTPNGKLDESALPDPLDAGTGGEVIETDEEHTVAEVWSRMLGIGASALGRDDNFFDVGGDSLLLIRLQQQLQEAFGRDVPVVELFRHTTVRAQAQWFAEASPRRDGLSAANDRAEQRRRRRGARARRRG